MRVDRKRGHFTSLQWTARLRLLWLGLTVTGFSVSASLLNFVAQAVLAARYGVGLRVDSYMFALSIPMFVAGVIAAIISYTVIPLIAQAAGTPARQMQLGRATFVLIGGVALLMAVGGLALPYLQHMLLPERSALRNEPALVAMIRIAWLVGSVQIVVALAGAQLNAVGQPLVATWLTLPTSIGTIAALTFFSHNGVEVALVGMLCGTIAAAAFGLWRQRAMLFPIGIAPEVRGAVVHLSTSAIWAALALSCFASFAVIDAVWAPQLGNGALASLGFAQRLINGVATLIVAGPSALFVPRFARHVHDGDGPAFRALLLQSLTFVGGLAAVAATVLFVASDSIVALLFRRGAFGTDDVAIVGGILRTMAPGVVAMLITVIVLRAMFCLPGSGRVAAVLGLGWSVSYFLGSMLLLGRGVNGIATAFTISWIGLCAASVTYVLYRSRTGGLA